MKKNKKRLLFGLAFVAGCIGCCTHIAWPPEGSSRIVPCKELVDDLRTLWSFERNYAYRNKQLASSIGEMGDGAGIGKDGFVLKQSLWESRLDATGVAHAASYRIADPKNGRKQTVGAYRFGIFPVLSENGEREIFSAILVSVPETPADDDACFVALCGPVDLKNDFSFDRDWPVYQLVAKSQVVSALKNHRSATFGELERRLTAGDLSTFVIRSFRGLSYPTDEK